jgi:amino acid exporter
MIFKVILTGIGVGLVLSVITGPVFFALLKTSVEKGFRAGTALALGVFLSDVFYVALTYFSTKVSDFESYWQPKIAIVGSVMLVGIGTYYLVRNTKINFKEVSTAGTTGYLVKGFMMNFFNPFVFIYWLSIFSIFSLKDEFTKLDTTVFFATTLATIVTSDILKAWLASRWRHLISDKLFWWLNRIAGFCILGFGIRMIIKIFIFPEI